jgi:hypothetical protein
MLENQVEVRLVEFKRCLRPTCGGDNKWTCAGQESDMCGGGGGGGQAAGADGEKNV